MKEAVIFGAGNVGRGFVAQLCSEAGLKVNFFDMQGSLIEAINHKASYPHYTISSEGRSETLIQPVQAYYASQQAEVNRAIMAADLIATAVGAQVLPKIAETLCIALEERIKLGRAPINILLCENLHEAAEQMRGWMHKYLKEVSAQDFDAQVGLLNTSIGRMIPVPTDALRLSHPAAIQVEPYKFLPYDIHAVKGELPNIPFLYGDRQVDFSFYADRKLYVHNMGHSMCAYLANYFSYEYIWQAIEQAEIRYFVHQAMNETARALAKKYAQAEEPLLEHVNDLLFRFSNRQLQDTTERVGRDPKRKLARGDRFLGAFSLCMETGSSTRFLSLGMAAALQALKKEQAWSELELEIFRAAQGLDWSTPEQAQLSLLKEQYEALAGGFDWTQQLSILNEKYRISSII